MPAYIEITDDGERRYHSNRPKWFNSDGTQLSDSELKEREATYPVVDEEVTDDYDSLRPKPKEDWTFETETVSGDEVKDYAVRTFWRVFDNEPDYDPLYQDIAKKDISEWTQDGDKLYKEWNVSELTVSQTQMKMMNEIADVRWQYETGGMNFTLDDGVNIKVDTTRESQSKIGMISLGQKQGNMNENKNWKMLEGFKELKPPELGRLGDELNVFVQSCYDNEKRVFDLIMQCVTNSECRTVYDNENEFKNGWPTNAIHGE